MAERSQPRYNAVVIPHPLVTTATRSAADSSVTQAGPQPGNPAAQQDGEGVLKSSGTQAADAQLNVKCIRAGFPGRNKAGHAWQQDGDSTWRGQDQPHYITGIEFENYGTYAATQADPHIITLSDDQVLSTFNVTVAGDDRVYVRRRSAAGVQAAEVLAYSEANVSNQRAGAALLELPSGKVLLFHWTFLNLFNAMQISVEFSDDKGDTWATYAQNVLPATIGDTSTDTARPLRVAYNDGQILLMVWWQDESATAEDLLYQYASDDFGASFASIFQLDGATTADTAGFVDVIALPSGGFLVGFVSQDDLTAAVVRLGSAFESLQNTSKVSLNEVAAEITLNRYEAGGLALAITDTGTIYCTYYNPVNEDAPIEVSYDDGATWTLVGHNNARAWLTADAGAVIEHMSATWQRSRMIVTAKVAASGGAGADDSHMYVYLGGSSDITIPTEPIQGAGNVASFKTTWISIDLPTEWAGTWSKAGAGAFSTEALAAPGVLDLASAGTRYYTYAPTTTTAQGLIVHAQFSRQSGTPGFILYLEDGASDVSVGVTISDTTVFFDDIGGSSSIGTATQDAAGVAVADDTLYQFLCAISGTSATLWFRIADTGEDREWTQVGTTTSLTTAALVAADEARWGHVSGAADSEWQIFQIAEGTGIGTVAGLELAADTQTNPDDLIPAVIGSSPTYIDGGVKLKATDGPFVFEDDFQIATRYKRPWTNVLPTEKPSPRDKHRSTDTSDQVYAFDINTLAGETQDWPSDMLAIYLDECTAPAVTIDTETTPSNGWGSGNGGITYAADMMHSSITYTRNGSSVELVSSSAGDLYVEEDELVGCSFSFSATKIRTITRNTSGYLSSGTAKRPRLYFTTVDDSEPSSGSGGRIYFKRALIVIQLSGAQMSGVRVTLGKGSSNAPEEGYFEVGTLLIGSLHVLGWDTSQTRQITRSSNVRVDTAPDGRRRTKKLGPARESFALNWTEGIETTPSFNNADDYVLASDVASAESVGMRYELPRFLHGLQEHLDGPATPFVWVPNFVHLTTANNIIKGNNAKGIKYGRALGPLTLDTLLGTEEDTEIVRVAWGPFSEEK